MKILITGGAGFVGYHLTKKLISLGHDIIILDDLSTGKKKNIVKNSKFVKDSILNSKCVSNLVKKVDLVFHLAAKVELQESIVNPEECFLVNVVGTANIVKNCVFYKKKLIFASSCSVYPLKIKSPISEKNILEGNSPYSISKIVCENLINFYSKKFNLKAVILRFFNIYGERQNVNSAYSAVIPTFINNVSQDKILKLYGSGKQKRDFININDVVEAYIYFILSNKIGIYNVGSGRVTSIKHLASLIIKITGKGKTKNLPALSGDAMYSCADISKIKKELNFKPKKTLKEGITHLINMSIK
jgi:UDP-glucose 4-epimerase